MCAYPDVPADAGRDVPSRSGLAQATAPPVRVLYNEESPRLRQRLVVASRTFLEHQFVHLP